MSDRYEENDSGQDIGEDYGWIGYVLLAVVGVTAFVLVLWASHR